MTPAPSLDMIVLARDAAGAIDRCLVNAADAAAPGDRIVAVDDGSTDGTDRRIRRFAAEGRVPDGVSFAPILLGTRTPGDLSIAANIALAECRSDACFFASGHGWPDPAGVAAIRSALAEGPHEFWLTPWTTWFRGRTLTAPDPPDARWGAIGLVPSLWRMVIRRSLHEGAGFRFLEGGAVGEVEAHLRLARAAGEVGFVPATLTHLEPAWSAFEAGPLVRGYREIAQAAGLLKRRTRFTILRSLLWALDRELLLAPPVSTPALLDELRRTLRRTPPWVWAEGDPAPPALRPLVDALRRGRHWEALAALTDIAERRWAVATSDP